MAPGRGLKPLFFFDLDDTLVDHYAAEEDAHREAHAAHGALFSGIAFGDWLAAYRRNNLRLWQEYGKGAIDRPTLSARRFALPLAELGLDSGHGAAIGTSYWDAYVRNWRLIDGAEDVLEFASELGVVGILSNGFREAQRAKIERFGLDRWARHVILSEDVGAMKPSRVIFDAAAKAAGGGERRRLYVGDTFATDILGARNAGWFPILFDRHGTGAPEPVVFVTRLSDLKPLF